MKKSAVCCRDCPFMKISRYARHTAANSHMAGPRGSCVCKHPDALAAFQLICPKSGRMPGFIAFTKTQAQFPDIKTAPRWCPRKLLVEAREISSGAADQVIVTRKLHGMFFLRDGGVYVGIDNRAGDAWTEDFRSKAACLNWLRKD